MAVFYACDYIFACTILSGIVSTLCLRYLWKVRLSSSKRLFWRQLVLLAAIDIIYCYYTLGFRVYWGLLGREVTQKMLFCRDLVPVRIFCEQLSCFVEVHIALGFAAACHGLIRTLDYLIYSVPVLLLVTGVWVSIALHKVEPKNWGCDTGMSSFPIWGQTVTASAILTVLAYSLCFVQRGSSSFPWDVKRRAILRTLSFLGSFMLTIGGRAFCVLVYTNDILEVITESLLALNGVAILGTYMFWMVRRAGLEERHRRREKESSQSLQLSTVEALIIDRHFDLTVEADDDVSEASRVVSEAVLLASHLRRNSDTSLPQLVDV